MRIARIFKDDNIATPNLALRQKRKARAGRKYKLVDEQVIAHGNRVLH
jgi:hypothetical protein